jgi:hypothetical protein
MGSGKSQGRLKPFIFAIFAVLVSSAIPVLSASAEELIRMSGDECGDMQLWDLTENMCEPLPMAGMPMRMVMLHGNVFGVRTWEQGPRGRDAWAGPSMVMSDAGSSFGERHYINLDIMATVDKWTFPDRGNPEFAQIGENDSEGRPFIDAQHPHSSPIMGLTLSDTIRLDTGEKDALKLFFAPRGESTDGPIAFMHRPTGMVNPDVPLGHHIGQDVDHITSTVIGGSLKLGDMHYELSAFNGTEPEPEQVDLPIANPNSAAVRLIRDFSGALSAMASFAYVKNPEPDMPDIGYMFRYSASLYVQTHLGGEWEFHDSFIFGAVTGYDHSPALYSLGEEFLFRKQHSSIWGRFEAVERSPFELVVASADSSARWVGALTLGYTQALVRVDEATLSLGGSATRTLLPETFIGSYGGNPWSGKIFFELDGMKMWDL